MYTYAIKPFTYIYYLQVKKIMNNKSYLFLNLYPPAGDLRNENIDTTSALLMSHASKEKYENVKWWSSNNRRCVTTGTGTDNNTNDNPSVSRHNTVIWQSVWRTQSTTFKICVVYRQFQTHVISHWNRHWNIRYSKKGLHSLVRCINLFYKSFMFQLNSLFPFVTEVSNYKENI